MTTSEMLLRYVALHALTRTAFQVESSGPVPYPSGITVTRLLVRWLDVGHEHGFEAVVSHFPDLNDVEAQAALARLLMSASESVLARQFGIVPQ